MLRLGIAGIGVIAGDYIGLIAGGRVQGLELTALCSRNEEHIQACLLYTSPSPRD